MSVGRTEIDPASDVPVLATEQSTEPTSEKSAVRHRNPWTIFAVVSVGLFMSSLDSTIVATALPTLLHDLHTEVNWVGWSITAYQLGLAVSMPTLGRLSDQFGRKRVFIICTIVFISASLACGLSTSIWMLIPFRVLQSFGGGGFIPSASGIISDAFQSNRDRPIGLFTSILPFGALVGPTIGGTIINYTSWRFVFFINVPIGIVLICLLVRILPTSTPRAVSGTDWRGSALLVATLTGIMLFITDLGSANAGLFTPAVLIPLLVAVISGPIFVRHLRSAESPIIPVKLLLGREFALTNFLNFLIGAIGIGLGTLIPLYAERRYRLGALGAGTLLSARGIGVMVFSTLASYSIRKTGYRVPMIVGFFFLGAGTLLVSLAPPVSSPYSWLAFAAALTGIGAGISLPATNNASLFLAPNDIAAAAGLRGMFRQCGAIIGVSIITAVVARSTHQGIAIGHMYFAFAFVSVVMIGFALMLRERKGAW